MGRARQVVPKAEGGGVNRVKSSFLLVISTCFWLGVGNAPSFAQPDIARSICDQAGRAFEIGIAAFDTKGMERAGPETWKMPLVDGMKGYLRLTDNYASARVNISRSSWDEAANAVARASGVIRSCLQTIARFAETRRSGEDSQFKSDGRAWMFHDDSGVMTIELGALFDKKNKRYEETYVLMLDLF